ncbi:MAG: DMT family transporter [Dokdonella sp.]|nr:DMT family transporter [Dokdonella sp.]MCW5566649.1 DMT family transporter [Dokdonella sp.]
MDMHARGLPKRGLIEMVAGASLISLTSVFVKLAHVGPSVSAFYRMAIGGVLLFTFLLIARRWRPLRARQLPWMLVPAAAFAADLLMWHRSILYVGPGLATLIGNFQVFLMALAGWLLYRERLGLNFVVGVILSLAGLYLLVGLDWGAMGGDFRLGVVLGIGSGVAYAVYLLATRHAQRSGELRVPTMQLLCVSTLLSAIVLGGAVVVEGESFAIPDAQTAWSLAGLAVIGQIVGWVLLLRAIPQLPASLVGLLLLLQPALSFVLDVLLFDRATSGLDWLGVGLALVGIFMGSWRPARRAEGAETEASLAADAARETRGQSG